MPTERLRTTIDVVSAAVPAQAQTLRPAPGVAAASERRHATAGRSAAPDFALLFRATLRLLSPPRTSSSIMAASRSRRRPLLSSSAPAKLPESSAKRNSGGNSCADKWWAPRFRFSLRCGTQSKLKSLARSHSVRSSNWAATLTRPSNRGVWNGAHRAQVEKKRLLLRETSCFLPAPSPTTSAANTRSRRRRR